MGADTLEMMKKIPILTYHGLSDEPQQRKESKYNVSVQEFSKQMEWLYKSHYKTLSLGEMFNLRRTQSNAESEVVITFDDGHKNNFKYALSILKEYGFRAIFFITTGLIDKDEDFMDWEQVVMLHNVGYDVQSHGHSHKFLNQMDKQQIVYELEQSKDLIAKYTGSKTVAFSCPGGRFNTQVIATAKELGYERMFTSEPQYFNPNNAIQDFSVGRIMVTTGIKINRFKRIIEGDDIYLAKEKTKYFLKGILKKITGDVLYHNIFIRKQ